VCSLPLLRADVGAAQGEGACNGGALENAEAEEGAEGAGAQAWAGAGAGAGEGAGEGREVEWQRLRSGAGRWEAEQASRGRQWWARRVALVWFQLACGSGKPTIVTLHFLLVGERPRVYQQMFVEEYIPPWTRWESQVGIPNLEFPIWEVLQDLSSFRSLDFIPEGYLILLPSAEFKFQKGHLPLVPLI